MKAGQSNGGSSEVLDRCANCKEPRGNCACVRNKCIRCGEAVGNTTFTVCDDCWGKKSV